MEKEIPHKMASLSIGGKDIGGQDFSEGDWGTETEEREENSVSAFSFFDYDGSGYITIDELQQACKEFGLSELHLDDMIKEIDQDNDGQIDYGEFAAMVRKGNGGIGRRTMRSTINLGEALGISNGSKELD